MKIVMDPEAVVDHLCEHYGDMLDVQHIIEEYENLPMKHSINVKLAAALEPYDLSIHENWDQQQVEIVVPPAQWVKVE